MTLCFTCHRAAHDGFWINNDFVTPRDFIIAALEKISEHRYEKTLEILKRKSNEIQE